MLLLAKKRILAEMVNWSNFNLETLGESCLAGKDRIGKIVSIIDKRLVILQHEMLFSQA